MATQHPDSADDAGDGEDLHDRSLGELLRQLSAQTTGLVHQELELAKAELAQKAARPEQAPGCSAPPGRSGWPPSAL